MLSLSILKTLTQMLSLSILLKEKIPGPGIFVTVPLKASLPFASILLFYESGDVMISIFGIDDCLNYLYSIMSGVNVFLDESLCDNIQDNVKYTSKLPDHVHKTDTFSYMKPFSKRCTETVDLGNSFNIESFIKRKGPFTNSLHLDPLSKLNRLGLPLLSVCVPLILYRTVPAIYNNIIAFVVNIPRNVVMPDAEAPDRLRQLNLEFDNRYREIMTNIEINRNQ